MKPLVIDADRAFLMTRVTLECLCAALSRSPRAALLALRHRDSGVVKAELARLAQLRTDLLPVNPDVKALATASRAGGRTVVLAGLGDEGPLSQLSRDHSLGGVVLGATADRPLTRATRTERIIEAFGLGGFDYAGPPDSDSALWDAAENVYIVGDNTRLARALTAKGKSVTQLGGGWRHADLVRALRPHQWVKNILLFVPMIAAHAFDLATFAIVLLGAIAFSAAASSIYVANDLLDLEADRLHPTKRHRPFASGKVPLRAGMATGLGLALLAVLLAVQIGPAFLATILVYVTLSLSYSFHLKRRRWIDIATLAALYTIRVVAGAAAAGIAVSGFLLAFIFPVFLTLGCAKRITEVTLAPNDDRLPGRGYGKPDRDDLLNVAALGVIGALLAFFLYSISDEARLLYPAHWLLWAAMVPLALWLLRMVRYGYVGKQDYDPIIFAMRDVRGVGLILLALALMFYAAGL